MRLSLELHDLPNDIWLRAIVRTPEVLREKHRARAARRQLLRCEVTADQRPQSGERENPGVNDRGGDPRGVWAVSREAVIPAERRRRLDRP